MKSILFGLLFLISIWACEPESAYISKDCVYVATVEDLTGLDGCGYLFKLENGDYLEPVWRWGFCGTPPLPEGATEDSLWNFNYKAGQRVRLGFEPANDVGSICMKGKPVIITCLEIIDEAPVE
ncbi:hypothetical protein JKA74_02840 [Marivirga sp. S37H4]|uniref:Uncharacterized protein n=1 Tax=Marivirga aurantiaca TaxID=2802615 RepID=A0A934WW01_9BACT|nr:hypothetical protein [Marivirga aurantiaca]MBK6263961.1 hypothetical protein [Marivirga aurantiaca]